MRLSQETLGNDVNIHLGLGTCTMKYSPKVNEELVRSPKVTELHPLQDEDTVQGMLEVMYRFERMLCEISGMDRFTFQPAGGSQARLRERADDPRLPRRAAARPSATRSSRRSSRTRATAPGPATAGFKVITLYAGEDGYPEPRRAPSTRSPSAPPG